MSRLAWTTEKTAVSEAPKKEKKKNFTWRSWPHALELVNVNVTLTESGKVYSSCTPDPPKSAAITMGVAVWI